MDRNGGGEVMQPVPLTMEEMEELIRLIDDDEVDEELLAGIRKKLKNRQKRLRRTLVQALGTGHPSG